MAAIPRGGSSSIKRAFGYVADKPLETIGTLLTVVLVILAWRLDFNVGTLISAWRHDDASVKPSSPAVLGTLPAKLAAFERYEADFLEQYRKLSDGSAQGAEAVQAQETASADLGQCSVLLKELRALDPSQSQHWQALEDRIEADQRKLAQLPPRPSETLSNLLVAYAQADNVFRSQFDAGERLLANRPAGKESPDFESIDKMFKDSLAALETRRTTLDRLARLDPSQDSRWRTMRNAIDADQDRLNDDWDTFEAPEHSK